MNKPLRICFLWHQHQPDYRLDNHFVLPWVRMHAAKDYRDLPRILQRFPVRHTINLVPSMLAQVDSYAAGMLDVVEQLCERVMRGVTDAERNDVYEWLVTLQPTMMTDLPRLEEIITQARQQGSASISQADAIDAMVLWHAAWCGPVTRQLDERIRGLIRKQRGFTTAELDDMLVCVRDAMSDVVPTMMGLPSEQFEVSVSPFHHPILPLVISTDAARECMPESPLPNPPYQAPDHARRHVQRALDDWQHRSGKRPRGLWSPEGSVSMESLALLASEGAHWTATDEDVLRASMQQEWRQVDTYAPYHVPTPYGDITVLFRDHALSDAIGFEYASWDADRAADDFVRRLDERRSWIIRDGGEEALEHAVVPIILDGENCWEFYPQNGEPFLNALMSRLSDAPRYTSMTFSEVHDALRHRTLHHVRAGSWIDANFAIWIGSPATNAAWKLLSEAKGALENAGFDAERIAEVMEVVEASDWFWWYDERHQAPHKGSFDVAFRAHIEHIFEMCGMRPPDECSRPLSEVTTMNNIQRIPVVFATSAMHRSQALVRDLALETHEEWQRLLVRLERKPLSNEEIVLQVTGNDGFERACLIAEDELLWRSPLHDEGYEWFNELELALYLHARDRWNVKVIEDKPNGAKLASNMDITSQ